MKVSHRFLRRERRRRLSNAERKLASLNDLTEVREELEWVELYDRLRQGKRDTWLAWLLIVGTAIVVALVVCSVWIHVPRADFTAELTVSSLRLVLARDWQLPGRFSAQGVVLEHMSEVSMTGIPAVAVPEESYPATLVEIRDGEVAIGGLMISAGANLDVVSDESEFELHIANQTLAGLLFITRGDLTIDNGTEPIDRTVNTGEDAPPEVLRFGRAVGSHLPGVIRLRAPALPLEMTVSATDLRLLERVSSSGHFPSSVVEGWVRVMKTGETTSLSQGDYLCMDGIITQRLEIKRSDDGTLSLTVEGSATGLRAGPGGFEKNLKPTLLTFVSHQSLLIGLLWVIAVLLPTVVWQVREIATRRK